MWYTRAVYSALKKNKIGVPTVAQHVKDLVLSPWWRGELLRRGFDSQSGLRIQRGRSCGVGCSCSLDPIPGPGTGMELEILLLSEVRQKEKDKYPIASHVESKRWHE